MKSAFSFLFCLFCLLTHAQTDAPVVRNRRFSLGASFTPALAYRFITHNSAGNPNVQTVINQRNDREIPRFGFAAGLHLFIRLRDQVHFETGVGYSEMGYQTKTFDQLLPPLPDPGIPSRIKYRYNIRYLDIPLKFHLEKGTGKVRFCASAGLIASITLGYTQTEIAFYQDGSRRENETPTGPDIMPVSIGITVGAGINYHITRKFTWKMEPVLRTGIFPAAIGPVAEFPFSIGLQSIFLLDL